MSDEIALQSVKGGKPRAVVYGAMLSYCLLLFLLFDFAYSSLTRGAAVPYRGLSRRLRWRARESVRRR